MKAGAVIVAAGKGRRMGTKANKVLCPLYGRPLLLWAVEAFCAVPQVEEVIIVSAPPEIKTIKDMVFQAFPNDVFRIRVIAGGHERQESVYNGICALREIDVACIHDGARPLVTVQMIEEGINLASIWGAAVPVIPVIDTIKRVKNNQTAITPPRDELRAVQTPQCFLLPIIMAAYHKANADGYIGSDDASLVEHLGHKVITFAGRRENLKITVPDDLFFAEMFLKRRDLDCSR